MPTSPATPPIRTSRGTVLRLLLFTVLLVTLVLLASCASVPPPPTAQLQAAETAIANAEQARVADYAFPDLNQAREKLSLARAAVTDRKMVDAARLADESRASAELALARTEMIKAKAVNDDMLRSLDALKQELLRNSGNRQ